MKKQLVKLLKDEDGQGMVEYGLIIGLIAIIVVAAFVILGPKISELFNKVNLDDVDEGIMDEAAGG